jgi:hypothetical protein
LSSISAAIEASLQEETAARQHEFCGKTHTQKFRKKLYVKSSRYAVRLLSIGYF